MKALRYLLMMVAVMGVLSVSAQTPKYGTTYKPEKHVMHPSVQAQLPEATMYSTGSVIMYSGSSLPQAAVTGVTTIDNSGQPGRHIRRAGEDDGFEDEGEGGEPGSGLPGEPAPIGDTAWPLALCALAYLIVRVVRRRQRA